MIPFLATRAGVPATVLVALAASGMVHPTIVVAADPPSATRKPEKPAAAAETTPEDVVREFVIAGILRDETRIKAVIVSNPDAAILWKVGPPFQVPPADVIPQMEAEIRKSPLKRLRVGDVVPIPGGTPLKLTERHVNADRMPITTPEAPLPFIVVRQADGWKVDAGPVITSQKRIEELYRERPKEFEPKK